MATATIPFAATNPNSIAWWRRRDPYVLFPLVIVHAVIAGPAVWGSLAVPSAFPRLHELFMGVFLAQCLLLGVWAALGCLPLIVRWALVTGAFLLGLSSFALAMRQVINLWIEVLECGLIGAMLVTLVAALLLPLRSLLSWRLDFDPSRHAPLTGHRGQVGFMSMAAFSLAIAAPLTIFRLIAESIPAMDSTELLVAMIVVPASIGVSACPIAWSLLVWRQLPLAIVAAPCWSALIGLSHALLSLCIPALSFFNDNHTWSTDCQEIAALHAGIAACIIPTFVALRLGGLKLFALPHANRSARAPLDQPVSLPQTATLPKAA